MMTGDGSPELTVGRTWETEVLVPGAREALRKARTRRRQRRRATKRKEPGQLRGPERWREWQGMLDEGVYPTKAALARSEGVSRAAVTLGLRKLEQLRRNRIPEVGLSGEASHVTVEPAAQ